MRYLIAAAAAVSAFIVTAYACIVGVQTFITSWMHDPDGAGWVMAISAPFVIVFGLLLSVVAALVAFGVVLRSTPTAPAPARPKPEPAVATVTLQPEVITPPSGFVDWLLSDWRFASGAEARRHARPGLGLFAWGVFNVANVVAFHPISTVGAPLAALWVIQRRGAPPPWLLVVLPLLSAVLFIAGWTNADELASGRGTFKLAMLLFTVRCCWAEFSRSKAARGGAVSA